MYNAAVLSKILGSGRDEVTGGWRKMHNEELHNLYFTKYRVIQKEVYTFKNLFYKNC
jgi:hypothetical protein